LKSAQTPASLVQNLFRFCGYRMLIRKVCVLPDIVSLKMLGVVGVASYAAARLAAKAGVLGYRRYVLVAVPVGGMPEMPRGFDVRPVRQSELARYDIDVGAQVQADRFAQGLTCLAAFNARGALVGVNWVGLSDFTESEVHVRFLIPFNAGWDCGLWIAPPYRMGRGFAALWAATGQWLRAQGREYSVSWIADYNLPSLLSHKRMGARTIAHLTALRFFKWQYVAKARPKMLRVGNAMPARFDLRVT
jgi:hypothetical protein